ncbi:MAG: SdpI family protein [Clostridia bacterium]|nr:SdpI family protein [Clostridia bacterium]
MIKKNKITIIFANILTLLPIVSGIVLWNKLPPYLPIHWNLAGNADSYGSKAFFVFGLPLIMLALLWVCILLTALDKESKKQNPKAVSAMLLIIPLLSCCLSGLTYGAVLYESTFPVYFINLILGGMFVIIGNYLPKCKQNKTMGIKIKWTLESEENWQATHRFGGIVWFFCGAALVLTILLPEKLSMAAMFVLLLVAVLVPTIYSYCYYKKQKKEVGFEPKPIYDKKKYRIIGITVTLVLAILFAALIPLMFTGNITVEYGNAGFKIEADYFEDLTVGYNEVDSVELVEDFDRGTRVYGFGGSKLLMGTFKSDTYGKYTLYAYTKCDYGVVVRSGEKTLIITGKDKAETEKIYEKLNLFCGD